MLGGNSLENQIAHLEARLAEKKGELVGAETKRPEKEILREVVQEHGSAVEGSVGSGAASTGAAGSTSRKLSDVEVAKISELVSHAFSNGIGAAVKEAQSYGDAFFVDRLHDRLVDEYYDRLIQARKINPD